MRYKKLGNTSIEISAIGQGGDGFLLNTEQSRTEVICAIKYGIELGMNLIDTAEIYLDGRSEEIIGKAIVGVREKVIIATKFSPENSSYNGIINSAEGSLKRLNIDYIDIYQLHWPNNSIPIAETLRAINKLLEDGKIRHFGVCNYPLGKFKELYEHIPKNCLVSVQQEYNLYDRSIEKDLLPFCVNKSLSFFAYTPLCGGKLIKNSMKMMELQAIAKKYNKTVAQIILNWLVGHENVIAIPKAVCKKHVQENAEAADFSIEKSDKEVIDKLFQSEIVYLSPKDIKIVQDTMHKWRAYETVEEALENRQGLTPSPKELSDDLLAGSMIKPIQVRQTNTNNTFVYELIGGRIRYWAWVIAFGEEKKMPALMEYL